VVELEGLHWDMAEELRERAKALRYHPQFPKGANINFYSWLDDTTVRVMTYERGVEDYTLACGTGCGSTASVLWTKGLLPGGVLTCQNKGGTLRVTVTGEAGKVTSLLLEGPAEVLASYEI
jgi:diaminopimelate epimerase